MDDLKVRPIRGRALRVQAIEVGVPVQGAVRWDSKVFSSRTRDDTRIHSPYTSFLVGYARDSRSRPYPCPALTSSCARLVRLPAFVCRPRRCPSARDRHAFRLRASRRLIVPISARAPPESSSAHARHACRRPHAQSARHLCGAARAATFTQRRIARRGCRPPCAAEGVTDASAHRAVPSRRRWTRSIFHARVRASTGSTRLSRRLPRISGGCPRPLACLWPLNLWPRRPSLSSSMLPLAHV